MVEQLTRRTITNEGALVAELKAVRQRGYALSQGEYVSELFCVAAPIRDRDTEVVAAIGIGATAADFDMNGEKMVREVVRAAQLASREQGWLRSCRRPSRAPDIISAQPDPWIRPEFATSLARGTICTVV